MVARKTRLGLPRPHMSPCLGPAGANNSRHAPISARVVELDWTTMALTAFGSDQAAIAASRITIADWFTAQVATRGQETALQQGDRSLSYCQLNDRVNRLVYWLATQGLARGDRIAVLSENRFE